MAEKLVLLWRPGRADRGGKDNRHQGRHAGNRQRQGGGEAASEPASGERNAQGRPGGKRHEGRPDGQRFEKRGERHGKGGNSRDGERGNGFKGGFKGKPGDGRKDEFRKDRPGSAPQRKPERPVDPDSPFAKLLALKAQLEKPNG